MKVKVFSLLALLIGLTACHSGNKEGREDESGGIYAAIATNPQEMILGKDVFEVGGMEIGGVEQVVFNQFVHASAYVVPAPGAISVVSSVLPGKVSKIFVAEGDRVRSGEVLFSMKGREIIEIQQAYAEAYLGMTLMKANYTRQMELDENKIGAGKDLLKAENELKVAQARAQSLKAQLSLLNIDTKQVEDGRIIDEVNVVSSLGGIVSTTDITLGSIVDSNVELMRIVNPEGLRLEINIFEKDLDLLKTGQLVRIEGNGNFIQEKEATLSKIGVEIVPETRSLTCIAELDAMDSKTFMVNQFVEVNVVICQREVKAVPEQALLMEDGRYYVLLWEKEEGDQVIFRKKQIEIGVIQKGMAELLGDEELGDVLIDRNN